MSNKTKFKRQYSGNSFANIQVLEDLISYLEDSHDVDKIEFHMEPKTVGISTREVGTEFTNVKFYFDTRYLDIRKNTVATQFSTTRKYSNTVNIREHVNYVDDDIFDALIDEMIELCDCESDDESDEEVEFVQDTFFNQLSDVGSGIKTLASLIQSLDEEEIDITTDSISYINVVGDWVKVKSINTRSGDITFRGNVDDEIINFSKLELTEKIIVIEKLRKAVKEKMFNKSQPTVQPLTPIRTIGDLFNYVFNAPLSGNEDSECCGECACNSDDLKVESNIGSIGEMVEPMNDKHVNETVNTLDTMEPNDLKRWMMNKLNDRCFTHELWANRDSIRCEFETDEALTFIKSLVKTFNNPLGTILSQKKAFSDLRIYFRAAPYHKEYEIVQCSVDNPLGEWSNKVIMVSSNPEDGDVIEYTLSELYNRVEAEMGFLSFEMK